MPRHSRAFVAAGAQEVEHPFAYMRQRAGVTSDLAEILERNPENTWQGKSGTLIILTADVKQRSVEQGQTCGRWHVA